MLNFGFVRPQKQRQAPLQQYARAGGAPRANLLHELNGRRRFNVNQLASNQLNPGYSTQKRRLNARTSRFEIRFFTPRARFARLLL